MDQAYVTFLTALVLVSSVWGLFYVTGAVQAARSDKKAILAKKRNGARLITVNGRILQERLAVCIMLSYVVAGLVTLFAPLGWARGLVVPCLVIGIVLTALKSYFRARYRKKAIDYLDATIPEEVPVEVVDHIDEAGKVDRLLSLEEGGK